MEFPTSNKKIKSILIKIQADVRKGSVTKKKALDLARFLIFFLRSNPHPSQTVLLLSNISTYLLHCPLKFLVSLIPYFGHGYIQDKQTLLKILSTYYFSNQKIVDVCISSLVMCAFKAVTESSEISSNVVAILDNVSPRSKIYDCVWRSVFTNSKARLTALNYLHYRLFVHNTVQALHALLTCLEDPSLQVKKSALDLLKRAFSFKNPDIDKNCKITILKQMLNKCTLMTIIINSGNL